MELEKSCSRRYFILQTNPETDFMNNNRELFASRLGFILMTAGCAIGLGNVWRFPYITGAYGGGIFVLLYLFFLALLGFPVLMMELAMGRAGRSTYPGAFRNLRQSRFKWEIPGYILFTGNMILLMFYTVVTGWLLAYTWEYVAGNGAKLTAEKFDMFLASPGQQVLYAMIALLITVPVCLGGVQKSVEKIVKVMMGGLFIILLILVINSLQMQGAKAGLHFFLYPDAGNLAEKSFFDAVHAAMAQAFFTLSIGIGSIAVCGSYFSKERSLPMEGFWIILLDTTVAVCAGLIIFPCCHTFNIAPDAGPPLIFITLPKVFQNMAGGRFWGMLFFMFLSVAALSTLIAVFENLVAFGMDEFKWQRKKSCGIFGVILAVLTLPCVFGFNIWQNFHPLGGQSNVLDLEDFIVSDNLLPLGALILTLFCMNRYGWGKDNFYTELNTGKGWKFPGGILCFYMRWILPLVIFSIWLIGILKRFVL